MKELLIVLILHISSAALLSAQEHSGIMKDIEMISSK